MLKVKNRCIVNEKGKNIYLRGVNAGGWLMMEAYFMHSANLPVHRFKNHFAKVLGKAALRQFEKSFRDSFIRERDFKDMAKIGFNCVRLPFNYRLIEQSPGKYNKAGCAYLDKAIRWAKKYKLYVILDLHAAPGCQNHDWHSDSAGDALLWKEKKYQHRTFALWEFLADRYKDEETVAGYDLLNEAVLNDARKLNAFYKQLIKHIRKVDRNHILFIEGNNWAMDLKCLDRFDDDNYVLSIHNYQPLEFTFNFVPGLEYPLKEYKYNKTTIRNLLSKYNNISKQRNVPIFVGEFGVNYRDGKYGEDRWLKDTLECFNSFGFHWTYWPYKAIKNSVFPDGVYSYRDNPPWVCREGPMTGWDTYHLHWRKSRKQMAASWKTENFVPNHHVRRVLKNAVK